jgi:hypothetical protein
VQLSECFAREPSVNELSTGSFAERIYLCSFLENGELKAKNL